MKVGFVIIARLKSTRLPYKVLMDLAGRTVIQRIIDRAKQIEGISNIILCTSTNPQDKVLVDVAKQEDIHYYMGSEEDVIERLLKCNRFYGLDYMIGITGDNPLYSIKYAKLIYNQINKGNFDYIKVKGLPLGCAPYGIKTKALELICRVKNISKTEIWGSLVDRPEVFDIKTLSAVNELNRSDYRLTMDYEEDYILFRKIHNAFRNDKVLNLYDVIDFLDNNPKVADLNKDCHQARMSDLDKNNILKHFKEDINDILRLKEEIYGKDK